jgi:hypothetical protein
MMFYDNTCGGLPADAKIALFRWQVSIPSIALAIQLSVVQDRSADLVFRSSALSPPRAKARLLGLRRSSSLTSHAATISALCLSDDP